MHPLPFKSSEFSHINQLPGRRFAQDMIMVLESDVVGVPDLRVKRRWARWPGKDWMRSGTVQQEGLEALLRLSW